MANTGIVNNQIWLLKEKSHIAVFLCDSHLINRRHEGNIGQDPVYPKKLLIFM
jgi:hypothetical protein